MQYARLSFRVLAAALISTVTALSPAAAEQNANLFIEVVNTLGIPIPSQVNLYQGGDRVPKKTFTLSKGQGVQILSPGAYDVYIHAIDYDTAVLVDVQRVTLKADDFHSIKVELVEGTGNRSLRGFDVDGDLVLDRLEKRMGTDPADPASYPGAVPVPLLSPVLSRKKDQWYVGDLHVRSALSKGPLTGAETVAELVKRAERSDLDFIAICDRDTMEATLDPGFESDKVVLIPAMEWGTEEMGLGLIYGPLTEPEPPVSYWQAQALCQRVQAQGGIFAVAHPLFHHAPWQWGLSAVNAIEVWARGWRDVPPLSRNELKDEYHRRNKHDVLVHSIARAASSINRSANSQATMFWDYELLRGLRASPIAGSLSGTPDIPMGRPLTHIKAEEKSVRGLLEGMRAGRTYVNAGPDAPTIEFDARVWRKDDDTAGLGSAVPLAKVEMGGVGPLGTKLELRAKVFGGKGQKVEIIRNGLPMATKIIDKNNFVLVAYDTPAIYSAYRMRVFQTIEEPGFGALDVTALSSPIYAMEFLIVPSEVDSPDEVWLDVQQGGLATGMTAAQVKEIEGRTWVRTQGEAQINLPETEGDFVPPDSANVIQIGPQN